MAALELIGVPFDGFGRPGNQVRAAAALRRAGLAGALVGHAIVDRGDLSLPEGTGERGPTSLLNEPALLELAVQLRAVVRDAVTAGRLPVVLGGDCSTLLGSVPGLADACGLAGLVHVDGHEDTMPLDVSEDGEAANAEIGLLLGLTGRTLRGGLVDGLPALEPDRLALLGSRDATWRASFNVASLAGLGVPVLSDTEVSADPVGAGRTAVAHVLAAAERWWLHVDLDVLDPQVFAAQGLPGVADEPGGLDWQTLAETLRAALSCGGCAGLSITIYDPDQDPSGRDAASIVSLVSRIAPALEAAGPGADRP